MGSPLLLMAVAAGPLIHPHGTRRRSPRCGCPRPACHAGAGGTSALPDRRFHVVIGADRGQQPVRAALIDGESRLGWQVMAAPAEAVVFQRAAHPVVSHRAVLQLDAAASAEARGVERTELGGAAVGVARAERPAEVPVRRERVYNGTATT